MPSLLDLPSELILHIASTYPKPNHLETLRNSRDAARNTQLYFERRDAFQALSQTSRALRKVFTHLRWECFESVYHRGHGRYYDIDGSWRQKLERLTHGLVETPELAAHVRIAVIAVRVSDWTPCPYYLLPCLESLANLHTLCLSGYLDAASALASLRLPQIRILQINHHDVRLLIPCCPKVKAVLATSLSYDKSDFQDLFDPNEKSLEELHGFTPNESSIEYLRKVAPNLQKISFTNWVSKEFIRLFRPFNHLQAIAMSVDDIVYVDSFWSPRSVDEMDEWMATAISILRGNDVKGSGGKKRVTMHYKWKDHRRIMEEVDIPQVVRFEDVEVD